MRARLDLDWSVRGFGAAILENEILRVTVLPELGGKIYQLVYKPADRDLLYHHPRVEIRRPVFGVNVDDWWTGGIEDAIPTGYPCAFRGEQLPYLGEVWSMPWTLERDGEASIRLGREGVITPFRIERRMEVRNAEPFVRVEHTITNLAEEPLPMLWGIHPALPIGPATHVQVPARTGVVADGGRLGREMSAPGSRYDWPRPELVDLGPTASGRWDLHYATDLLDGWLTVRDDVWGVGFGMTFPQETMRAVWLWLVDGGWRGLRCLTLEPWLGYPARLDQAFERGLARVFKPGERLVVNTRFIAFRSDGPIAGFAEDGRPIPEETP
jgi:Domain of unknown function (DUF5107)